MTESERENLIRRYAACDISWRSLQEHGFEDYVEVLAALANLGLRPPIAPPGGPNAAARERGVQIIREALARR